MSIQAFGVRFWHSNSVFRVARFVLGNVVRVPSLDSSSVFGVSG